MNNTVRYMDNDLEKLKQHWQGLNNLPPAERCDRIKPDGITAGKVRSYSQRLIRDYTILIVLSLVWLALSPFALYHCGLPLWTGILISVFFGIMALSCASIRASIQRIDLSRMGVCEVLECVKVVVVKRRRHQWLGIPMAVCVMAMMFYFFYGISEYMLIGGVVGAILGGVIGMISDMRMRGMLREMQEMLSEARGDDSCGVNEG